MGDLERRIRMAVSFCADQMGVFGPMDNRYCIGCPLEDEDCWKFDFDFIDFDYDKE